jgi:hypothetical protein
LIIHVGIDNKNSLQGHQHPKKSTTMAEPNRLRKKLFIEFIYFNILPPAPNSTAPEQSNAPPPALPDGRASYPIPLLSRPRVFGWLLHIFNSSGAI